MTKFAQHRATVEYFVDSMHGGADKDALARVLAENVVLISPLSDEPLTGREAVTAAIQGVSTVAADLTYKEVLSGETTTPHSSGCRSKTRRSTEWTTSSSTRTARLPR